MQDNIYYSYDKLFSYNALLNFVVGERGCGKSFGAKVAMIKRFIKHGEQFIYLRRYKTELDTSLQTFWSDIQSKGYFDDLELKVNKKKMLTEFTCDGEVCGYAVPLSTSNILKSTAFPDVGTIVFDEFILDNSAGTHHYLRNEVSLMLDIIETVGRLRDIRVIFLGNAISTANPYFSYFNLDLPYNSEFKSFKDGAIVVNYIKNLKYREAKKKSRFYKVIEGTSYADYAVDNKWYRDDDTFIEKKPPEAYFWGVLVINGENIGIWRTDGFCIYLSPKYDPNCVNKVACDVEGHNEQTFYLNLRENYYIRCCTQAYKQGILRFENMKIKNEFMPILNKCIVF